MNQTSFWKAHFLLLLCLTIGLWSLVFYLVPRGFEMTDNALYLLSFRYYEDFTATISLFATIIKPIYDIAHSITVLRLLGLLIYFVVSLFCAYTVTRYFLAEQHIPSKYKVIYMYMCGLVITVASTLQYSNWINTPNYNWLNHIGLMLFLSGLFIWINRDIPEHSFYAPFFIMFGFGLSFWAKITTAILMPTLVLIILLTNRNRLRTIFSKKHFFSGLIGSFLSFTLIFLQGETILESIAKIQASLDIQASLNTGYENIGRYLLSRITEILGLLYPIITYAIQYWLILIVPIIIVLILSFYIASQTNAKPKLVFLIYVILFFGWTLNISVITQLLYIFQIAVWSLRFVFITFIFVAVDTFVRKLFSLKNKEFASDISVKPTFGWAVLIFFIPSIFSFGTETSFTLHTGWAAFFYILSSIILVANPQNTKNYFMLYIAPLFITLMIIYVMIVAANEPYRQTSSLFRMKESIQIQFGADEVLVGQSMEDYMIELQLQAEASGFVVQTPIVDFTGNSLGSIVILDARSYVLPWFPDNIAENQEVIIEILSRWQLSDLKRAWLITNTDSSLEPETEILAHFGLDLATDYEEVFTITRPYREGSQTFWRPINTP